MIKLPLLVVVGHLAYLTEGSSYLYKLWISHTGNSCEGTPYNVYSEADDTCAIKSCVENENTSTSSKVSIECTYDYKSSMNTFFNKSPFIMLEVFHDSDCKHLSYVQGYYVSGECEGTRNVGASQVNHIVAKLNAHGSAVLNFYSDSLCTDSELSRTFTADTKTLETHQCGSMKTKGYYFNGDVNQSSSGASLNVHTKGIRAPAIIAIIVGVSLFLVCLALGICCCKQGSNSKQTEAYQQATESLEYRPTASFDIDTQGQVGLWNDDVIIARRISRDSVRVKKLISRGAFGEVFVGIYNSNHVAVKMLLSHTRENLQQVNEFLAEAMVMASMDHPRIVAFLGVAWDTLSDMCVVLEFMKGGDLRAFLRKYEESRHRCGFDRQKTTIALHVCHALTYMHSLLPPVIHGDLKSQKILLNCAMEAKVTDFGMTRDRRDQTMTAGMGSKLWMAPEVMLGKRYDVKADLFSFGVVLSELDWHTLPYAQAKDEFRHAHGRKAPDVAILHQVAMGTLQVKFSQTSSRIVELGRACVSMNPNDRPTAAEALYRLQVILEKEMSI